MDRAERRRRTANIVRQRLEFVALIFDEWVSPRQIYRLEQFYGPSFDFQARRENQVRAFIGRSKTMHPMDCGKTRCGVCSGYKRFRAGPTRKELLAEFDFYEQIREFNGEAQVCRLHSLQPWKLSEKPTPTLTTVVSSR